MRRPLALPPTAAQLARYRDPVKVQIFYDSMMKMGITFELDQAGRVVATGRAVSPLIQEETDRRAELLRPIIEAREPAETQPKIDPKPTAKTKTKQKARAR